jgi:hypothetical protein
MAILFNHAITRVNVHPKYKPLRFECSLSIERDFKKKIGVKYWFFPIYEIIPAAVVRNAGLFHDYDEFVCELKDFESEYYYFGEDDVLYEKPHCTICMSDKSSKEIHFDTVEELNAYVDELKSKAPHIEI